MLLGNFPRSIPTSSGPLPREVVISNTFINISFFNMVFENFGQNLDHFGINRRPQDVKTMSSQPPGDVLKTNFWTSRNGHFAAWVYTQKA